MGASVNIKNHSGETPLHIAARHEMEYIVKLLLHYNAGIHKRNNRNETAMNLTKNKFRLRFPSPSLLKMYTISFC